MTSNFLAATRALLILALLAPLPSFAAIGRDLSTPRIATPYYGADGAFACTTEKGFLLRWGSQSRAAGTTADAEGVPRLPASSMLPASLKLFPNGAGCLGLSENGIVELDADGVVRRTVVFEHAPLFSAVAAFDGTNFFLVGGIVGQGWTGTLVDRNGHVLSKTTLPIPEGDPGARRVTASPGGGFTVFVAQGTAGIYTIRINAAGQVMGTVAIAFGNARGGYIAAIATNAASGKTVAAWAAPGAGSTYVHTVALNGDSAGPDVILPPTIERTSSLALLPSGSGFVLLRNAYVDTPSFQQRVLALRLDATGAPREASPVLLLNGSFASVAATSRTLVMLAYGDKPNATLIEASATITGSGIVPAATYDVLATAVQQFNQVVASDGVDFFASWTEMTSTRASLVTGRVTRSGVPLDGTGRVIAEAATPPTYSYTPSVAFGAGVYLVVFEADGYRAMGQRFARDGTPIDPAPFVIAQTARLPLVAFGGGRFLVTWGLVGQGVMAGAMVGSDGSVDTAQVLTPRPPLPFGEELQGPLTIAWNGRHFILISSNGRMLRISPIATPIDGHTIGLPISGSDSTMACSDQECVVSFLGSDDAGYNVIRTAVVHDDAALRVDTPKIVTHVYFWVSYAAIAFDGAAYVLAWRSGASLLGVARISRTGEPYALATTGAVTAFPQDSSSTYWSYPASPPALAANSAGDTAIVTTEYNLVWMTERARFYFASEIPLPRHRGARP
jgi:hypothetical protein